MVYQAIFAKIFVAAVIFYLTVLAWGYYQILHFILFPYFVFYKVYCVLFITLQKNCFQYKYFDNWIVPSYNGGLEQNRMIRMFHKW